MDPKLEDLIMVQLERLKCDLDEAKDMTVAWHDRVLRIEDQIRETRFLLSDKTER